MNLKTFLANDEDLKLAIMDYEYANIDIINFSYKYLKEHWKILSDDTIPKKEKEAGDVFFERLNRYLFNRKISELLVILYLLDLKNVHPKMYELNKLLKRTESQYSATHKEITKLCALDILRTEEVGDSRKSQVVHINKTVTRIYGDDEFRQAQLNDWQSAKEYIEGKLTALLEQKKQFMDRLEGM